jgi:hypothetical protein
MAESSLARPAQESPELVECFRHEGEECPLCDGSGFRPRKRCEGCGEHAGRPSEGSKALRRRYLLRRYSRLTILLTSLEIRLA